MPAIDPTTPATCHPCLVENLMDRTIDVTAISDVGRPHRAFRRGSESTKDRRTGKKASFDLPKKSLLTQDDFNFWFAEMATHMSPASLAVYRATINMGLEGLRCEHGGWGGDLKAESALPTAAQGPRSSAHSDAAGNPPSTERTGFKISVAQKSMSLALKHAYAHGKIPLPPICPVDRIVLNLATSQTGVPWFTNWTEVNNLAIYNTHLNHLQSAAAKFGLDLAAWEILGFEAQLPSLVAVDEGQRLSDVELASMLTIARRSFLRRFGTPEGDARWMEAMLRDALKSSLQHNPTYATTTSGSARIAVKAAMRSFLRGFVTRWMNLPPEEQTIEAFKMEVLAFQQFMNDGYSEYFR